jgi:hypothetical protein
MDTASPEQGCSSMVSLKSASLRWQRVHVVRQGEVWYWAAKEQWRNSDERQRPFSACWSLCMSCRDDDRNPTRNPVSPETPPLPETDALVFLGLILLSPDAVLYIKQCHQDGGHGSLDIGKNLLQI